MKLRTVASAATLAILLTALGACGDDSDGDTSGDSGAGGSSSAGLEEAQAVFDAGSEGVALAPDGSALAPGEIAAQELGPVEVEPGTSVFFVTCAQTTEGCVLNVDSMREAADAAGASFDFCANPDGAIAGDQKCMEAALQADPDIIVTNSINPENIATQLDDAKAAGIEVIDQYGQVEPDPAREASPFSGSMGYGDAAIAGDWLAAAITVESEGDANVLYVGTKSYAIDYVSRSNGVKDGLEKYCPSCSFDTLNYDITQLDQLPSQIQAYLQSHPDVTWIVGGLGIAGTYAVDQVRQASKTGSVSVATFDQDAANLPNLQDGDILKFDMATARLVNSWASVDIGFRLVAGQDFDGVERGGLRIMSADNVDEAPWDGPADFQESFKKLWGVS